MNEGDSRATLPGRLLRLVVTLWGATAPLVGGATLASGQEAVRLDRLAESQASSGVASGWRLRAVGDAPLAETRVERVDGALALILSADSAAGQAWMELDEPLDPGAGTLSWEWSLAQGLQGTSLRDPDRDDAAGRFFVVFGGAGLFGRPRIIFYSWGRDEAADEAFLSHVSDRAGVVVVRNGSDRVGDWHTERRDPAADFRRVFGRDPDEIRAVGLMADTDQLGGRAEVRLRVIRWAEHAP